MSSGLLLEMYHGLSAVFSNDTFMLVISFLVCNSLPRLLLVVALSLSLVLSLIIIKITVITIIISSSSSEVVVVVVVVVVAAVPPILGALALVELVSAAVVHGEAHSRPPRSRTKIANPAV